MSAADDTKTVVIPCPECGSPIDLQEGVLKGEHYLTPYMKRFADIPVRLIRVPAVAFCSGCDFCLEVWPEGIRRT